MTDLADREDVSGWAVGGVVFAGTVMVLVGLFQFFQGLAAIINDDFFVVLPNYAFNLDTTAWGWVHLILGIILALAGFYLFTGNRASGVVAIVIAVFVAVANFFFIPYYPFWSLVIIALSIYVMWAVSRAVFES